MENTMILKPNLLSQGQMLFSQDEFNKELGLAKEEIIKTAIESVRSALLIEREACAAIVEELAKDQDIGTAQVMVHAAEAIRNRIPSQRI